MVQNRTQALLQPSQIDPRITTELAPIEDAESLRMEAYIVDRILTANRSDTPEMSRLRQEATDSTDWKLENGLVQYKNRLYVPENDNLRTYIIREAHDQVSTAHPGQSKTIKILRSRYYWPKTTFDNIFVTVQPANALQSLETRPPACYSHYRFPNGPGNIYPWILSPFLLTKLVTT
jgi:hypothetical protein